MWIQNGNAFCNFSDRSFKKSGADHWQPLLLRWCRIYSIPNKEINLDYLNFRTRQGNIIPYVNLLVYDSDNKSKDKLPLNKIVFGPALEKELTYKSLRLLLNKYKYEGVIIEQSKVPYKD